MDPVLKKLRANRSLPVDAFDRDFKTKMSTGTLLTIDNQVDVNTGTVRFRATFPNKDNALFSNQFVTARLLVLVDPIRELFSFRPQQFSAVRSRLLFLS